MEFQRTVDGRNIYPSEFKKKVLEEIHRGVNPHELGRRYKVPVQNIIKWKKAAVVAITGTSQEPTPSVPVDEYLRLVEENDRLRKSLANMALERDIFKDAADYGVKKKWIAPVDLSKRKNTN